MKSEILSEETIEQLNKKGWTLTNDDHIINPKQEIVYKVPMSTDTDYLTTIIPYHEILILKLIKVEE